MGTHIPIIFTFTYLNITVPIEFILCSTIGIRRQLLCCSSIKSLSEVDYRHLIYKYGWLVARDFLLDKLYFCIVLDQLMKITKIGMM